MTYSIVAKDPETGHLGIAVASRFFAVGALVPHIRRAAAVATQAFVNPMWGVEGVHRLADGASAPDVIADFIARDDGQSQRQAHMIDARGVSVAHTGADCIGWAGHAIGDGVSVAGNMLVGPQVVADTLAFYLDNSTMPMAQRLLGAMQAGEDAGGDKRGRQSAALRIHHGQDFPRIDLRADDHGDPLSELRRLLRVAEERFLFFAREMGTAEDFSGRADRPKMEADITRAKEERLAAGVTSASHATTTGQ